MTPIQYVTPELIESQQPIWVNPVGGLGDVLMMSTALKHSFDKYGRQFHMSRRSRYTPFFTNHPAVAEVGIPPVDAIVVCNDYWSRTEFNDPNNKALHITCKIFGVEAPADDALYLPEMPEDDATKTILEYLPKANKTVVFSTSSASPRKIMHPAKWHNIVNKLLAQNCAVIQVGEPRDIYISGAYSLLGATNPFQLCAILRHADLVISSDNFVMHAARLANVPTIALFGPTEKERYCYSTHFGIQGDRSDCEMAKECLGPTCSNNYTTPCPRIAQSPSLHCMNRIDENKVVDIAMTILNK